MNFLLSEKAKDFLRHDAPVEFMEGTTYGGKTTVANPKFGFKVSDSKKKLHIIAGLDLGTIEKNILNKEYGLLEIFDGLMEYYPNGKGEHSLSHIRFKTPNGDKIIYLLGYKDVARWKKVLGGQYGCVFIDEINVADIDFVREIAMRCDYLLATLNPDNPALPIYAEFINHARPIEKYKDDAPTQLLEELHSAPAKEGWTWWFFSFKDNLGASEEKIKKIIENTPVGTKQYKNKIQGLRGKATGLVFPTFDERRHVVYAGNNEQYNHLLKIKENTDRKRRGKDIEVFTRFSAGLDTSYSKKTPDTIAMSFIGITNKNNLYILDERALNNRDLSNPIAPSDLAVHFVNFLNTNKEKWGFALNVFLDSADSGTMMELKKYKVKVGTSYNFIEAWKSKMKIIERIDAQNGWFAKGNIFILDHCKNYINELNCYSWQETKDIPEDANDHMINSVQYAFIPYAAEIGKVAKVDNT